MNKRTMAVIGILVIIICFNGCCTTGPVTLPINYIADQKSPSPLASISPLKIKVNKFRDMREKEGGPLFIGETFAAFNVPMAKIYAAQDVPSIIIKTIEDEFTRNKHQIVTDGEDVVINGDIQTFWIGTDVTALYWDVYGEIGLVIKIYNPVLSSSETFGPYYSKQVERTYSNPSQDIMKKVIEQSLEEIMRQISSDKRFLKSLANTGRS